MTSGQSLASCTEKARLWLLRLLSCRSKQRFHLPLVAFHLDPREGERRVGRLSCELAALQVSEAAQP